jgi:hypothetical protein
MAWFLAGILAVMAAGCTHRPYNPFRTDPMDLYSHVKNVAVAPVRIQCCVEDPKALQEKFAGWIAENLKEAGFAVVGADVYEAAWNRLGEEAGGFYDPFTGKKHADRLKEARTKVLEELKTKHGTQAMLWPAVETVEVGFYGPVAHWHGVSEPLWATGKGGSAARGVVGALSLYVSLEKLEGDRLYLNAGGIQLLGKFESRGKSVAVPEEEILTSTERNRRAVDIAMEWLVKKTEPPGAPSFREASKAAVSENED